MLWFWLLLLLTVTLVTAIWIRDEAYPRFHLWRESKKPLGLRCPICQLMDRHS